MERVIRAVHDIQGGERAEPVTKRTQQHEICQRVAGALEKQHRHPHAGHMLGALCAGSACRMKWKAEKHETANARHARSCGRSAIGKGQRRHAAPK
jgi:hypothetical protein